MMVRPETPEQLAYCRALIQHSAGVGPSPDQQFIVWTVDDKPALVVCFNGFFQKCCQIHVAMAPGYRFTPRKMLRETFSHAFETLGMEVLIGLVSSANDRALRYDLHLGFKELARLPGVHVGGSDLVILQMWKKDCRYLRQELKAAA